MYDQAIKWCDEMILRMAVTFLTISAFCRCFAVTIDVPRLPASPHVDAESSADITISGKPTESALRLFKLKMVIGNATPTNSLSVLLGKDNVHIDGCLTHSEVDLQVSWDSGAWTLTERGMQKTYSYTPPPKSGNERTLDLEMRLDSAGNPSSLIFKRDGVEFVFPGLTSFPAIAGFKPEWSMMRVVSRGCGTDETLKASLSADGGVIILR